MSPDNKILIFPCGVNRVIHCITAIVVIFVCGVHVAIQSPPTALDLATRWQLHNYACQPNRQPRPRPRPVAVATPRLFLRSSRSQVYCTDNARFDASINVSFAHRGSAGAVCFGPLVLSKSASARADAAETAQRAAVTSSPFPFSGRQTMASTLSLLHVTEAFDICDIRNALRQDLQSTKSKH